MTECVVMILLETMSTRFLSWRRGSIHRWTEVEKDIILCGSPHTLGDLPISRQSLHPWSILSASSLRVLADHMCIEIFCYLEAVFLKNYLSLPTYYELPQGCLRHDEKNVRNESKTFSLNFNVKFAWCFAILDLNSIQVNCLMSTTQETPVSANGPVEPFTKLGDWFRCLVYWCRDDILFCICLFLPITLRYSHLMKIQQQFL